MRTRLSSPCIFFFFQAEDGIRDLVRSRGLGDVYKRQGADRMVLRDELAVQDCLALMQVALDPADDLSLALSLIHI
mgnify:CR=1 FL=1